MPTQNTNAAGIPDEVVPDRAPPLGLALMARVRDVPMRVGVPTLAREDNHLCRVSLYGDIPRAEKDAAVSEAIRDARRDRAVGCIAGMVIADAVGQPLEFLHAVDPPAPGSPSFDLRTMTYTDPRNAFGLKPGQWTDDGSMGLCMADSLIVLRRYDGSDLRVRFWNWWYRGYNNAFRFDPDRSASVGLGGNIAASLSALEPDAPPPPRYGALTQDSGNGSIMRLAAVPIFFHRDAATAARFAAESSLTTHPGPLASEACAFLAWLLVRAIESSERAPDARRLLDAVANEYIAHLGDRRDPGVTELRALLESRHPDDSLERNWNWRSASLDIAGTLRRRGDSYNGYPVNPSYFGAYCMDGLAMALHAVYHSASFGEAIERCVNFLGDADSTAAVAGQIAGALYGYASIDPRLVDNLRRWDDGEVALRGVLLYDLGEERREP